MAMDFLNRDSLDDIQFRTFMHYATDLSRTKIMRVFDTLVCRVSLVMCSQTQDVDDSGTIEFDEFYILGMYRWHHCPTNSDSVHARCHQGIPLE